MWNGKRNTVRISDTQREENFDEFLRLQQDHDYLDVTYDEQSGGVSAVHIQHKFAKKKGVNGMRQGDYERTVLDVLRKCGHRIVLGPETNMPGIKSFDGFLDDIPMEIKAIEGNGLWAVSTKMLQAEKQRAECVILFFPQEEFYSSFRISEGIRLFRSGLGHSKEPHLSRLMVIVRDDLVIEWDKKATPIEGWSIQEGLRRENGADSYTLSPSDAKI